MSVMSTHARTAQHKKLTLSPWQTWTVGALIAAVAIGLATYAAAASYESVSHEAALHGLPLWRFYPLSLEGGLFGVIIVEIALEGIGYSFWWLRAGSRVLAVAVIAANAAAGWPDPVSMALRMAAPFLFVILIETARSVILERNREGNATRFPFTRWVLAPRQTFAIWKRMKLWEESTLPKVAVDAELAIVRLSGKFGKQWAKQVPPELVFMIRAGVRMDQALKQVAELTAPSAPEGRPGSSARKRPASSARKPARKRAATSARKPMTLMGTDTADLTTEAQALNILAAHPGISGSELGRQLGKTDRYGRDLIKRLATVAGPDRS